MSIAAADEVVKPLKLFQELVFEIVGEPVPKLAWLHLGDRVAGRKTDLPRSPSSNQTVHAVWLLLVALDNLRKFVNKNLKLQLIYQGPNKSINFQTRIKFVCSDEISSHLDLFHCPS